MGTLHKSLKDITKLMEKGKKKHAKQVLDEYIHQEHHFHADIHHLMSEIQAYHNSLEHLHESWDNLSKKKKVFEDHVNAAQMHLRRVKYIISKLVRVGKIKIE